MCDIFGSKAGQQQAQDEQARINLQQQQHDAAVKTDIGAVDSAFKPFNDDYYHGFQQSYTNAMNPQLDYQYGQAKDKLGAGLAATDRDMGSTGSAADAQLYGTYGNARAGIGNAAVDASNQLRSTVNNAKNSMYGLAEQATDPLSMATQAQASAGSIVAPQSYPGLGNVFGDILSPLAGGLKTSSQGQNPNGGISSAFNFPNAPIGGQSKIT